MKKNLLTMLLALMACWLVGSQAYALEEKEGVYQISNAQDLEDFSALVAEGNGAANAVLTADIDMTGVTHQPIGTSANKYTGTFDGQQHFIKNMKIDMPDVEYVGLFGVLANGAYIKNVILAKSCALNGKSFVALAGGTQGSGTVTFENCGNEGSVSAQEANAAGICGVSMGGSCGIVMMNCFNTGGISGARECAALCGWVGYTGSVIQNCYNAGFVIGLDGTYTLFRNTAGKGTGNFDTYGNQGTKISDDEYDLEYGAVCYQLNGNQSADVTWYQTIGEDAHPVPFSNHGVIYAVGELNCDGTSKGGDTEFSNSNSSTRDPHEYVDGICKNCGDVDKNYLPLKDGYYEIGTAKDLYWFSQLVYAGNKKTNARLTADIDFTEYTKQDIMIGGDAYTADEADEAHAFNGIFDGQGHKITIQYNSSYDGVALFKVVTESTIKNLMVEGSMESTQRFMGGLGFVSRGTSLYENVVVNVNMTGYYPGDATHGGLFAVTHESVTFRNCAFIGSMNAADCEGSAAIIGYAHGNVETLIENCYVAPTLLSLGAGSTVIARHVNTKLNCYYTDDIVSLSENAATVVSKEMVASGELCYKLNTAANIDAWRQNLGTDLYPVPFKSHAMVYATGALDCSGKAKGEITYSNTNAEPSRDAHNYVDDICSVCGARIIRTAKQLDDLATAVNTGELVDAIQVDMVEDIDMGDIDGFQGIGTRFKLETGEKDGNGNPIINDEKRPFTGTFDGHGHRVKNMIIDTPDDGNKGLFGFANGATIKNVVIDASCEIYAVGYAAGILGTASGRNILTIENCGNEAMVNVGTTGPNGAGILGVNDGSEAYVRIINCYNTGDIVGQRECGGISGWLGDRAEVVNCWNSGIVSEGAVDGDRTFARYNGQGAQLVNCYEVDGRQVNNVQMDDVSSGKLCFLVNKGAGETIFYQTLGSDLHPVLDATHGVVYVNDKGEYTNDASQASAIEPVAAAKTSDCEAVYSLSGARQMQLKRGINIVRQADGRVVKVLVK